ncbi:MAG: hypothetical protein K2H53_02450 [Clostridia bacterium]|nr:hypothetical protein [Clostridia bacterium]
MRQNEEELKTTQGTERNGITNPNGEDRREEESSCRHELPIEGGRVVLAGCSNGVSKEDAEELLQMGKVVIEDILSQQSTGLSEEDLEFEGGENNKEEDNQAKDIKESKQDAIKKVTKHVSNFGIAAAVLVIAVIVIFSIRDIMHGNKTEELEKTTAKESIYGDESDNQYFLGSSGALWFMQLRSDVVTLYNADDVTYDQLNKYVEYWLDLAYLAYNDSEISRDKIEKYNNMIKEISLINYDRYQIKSSGDEYIRGFKDYLKSRACIQIVEYYYNLGVIPENKYKALQIVANQHNDITEEYDLNKIISYAKEILEEYVGDLDQIIVSTEWREFTTVEDFLTKLSN